MLRILPRVDCRLRRLQLVSTAPILIWRASHPFSALNHFLEQLIVRKLALLLFVRSPSLISEGCAGDQISVVLLELDVWIGGDERVVSALALLLEEIAGCHDRFVDHIHQVILLMQIIGLFKNKLSLLYVDHALVVLSLAATR